MSETNVRRVPIRRDEGPGLQAEPAVWMSSQRALSGWVGSEPWAICNLLGASLWCSARGQDRGQDRGQAGSSCRPPRAGGTAAPRAASAGCAAASGDAEQLLGQMSYIKWQVINSR